MSGSVEDSVPAARRPTLAAPLSRSALDRDYLSRLLGPEAMLAEPGVRLLVLHAGRALGRGGSLALLAPSLVPEVDPASLVFLGRPTSGPEAGVPVLAIVVEERIAAAFEGEWIDLRREGASLDARDAGLLTQALALANWHAVAGFSPETGVATTTTQSGWVRVDPVTGREHYPRTDPAVIVAVRDDADRLLLGSNIEWDPARFSLLAGFVEPGESLEAAVIREIFEEAGVVIDRPEYRGSQPWPFPASLMLGFEAWIAPGASSVPQPDGTELRELRWFTRGELADAVDAGGVLLPGPSSIARVLIEDWFGGPVPQVRP